MTFVHPDPPPGVILSPIPEHDLAGATSYCNNVLRLPCTARWLKAATDRGDLACNIVGGRRLYSTQALFDLAVTPRPTKKSILAGK